ncbi:MAG TPA: hypothetical protein VNO14_18830 [Blastocatellia bacterium]|nr:hypothetical protein [Blastocatellia bacterium]
MSKAASCEQETDALDELIESHLHTLFEMLTRPHSLEELRAEVNTLNELLSSFSRRNELIQMLGDNLTPEPKRNRIREVLKAQQIRISESREEISQLRERSSLLIKRAVTLISRAQRVIDKQAYKHTGYALETCGLCKGLRHTHEGPCAACKGEGTVLVRQPAHKCARCKGEGMETSSVAPTSRICMICSGTGWIMAAART